MDAFLPICWGGCPKKHLEGDIYSIREQGFYWRKNLARIISNKVGREVSNDFEFTESDQFRDFEQGESPFTGMPARIVGSFIV